MFTEILEQPEVVQKQISYLFERSSRPNEKLVKLLDHGRRELYVVGCGTSYNAGLIAQHLISRHCNIDIHTSISSEFYLTEKQVERGGVVVAISQSGGTADTIEAIKYAKERNFGILSYVNNRDSPMEKMSDYTIPLNAGPEFAIASTKAYTVQVATAACMAYFIMNLKKRVLDKDTVRKGSAVVGDALKEIIDRRSDIQKLAKIHAKSEGVLFIGKGIDYVTCREARLKMSEVNYVMASALPADEFRHGPIAMIDDTRSVIGVVSDKEHLASVEYNLKLAKAQGARTILISPYTDENTKDCCDDHFQVSEVDPFFAPIISIVPIQLLVYYIGVEQGHDIDSPRNLVKCVGEKK